MDIRLPIGGLLAAIGLIMAGHSFTLGPQDFAKSLGMNLNLYWGLVLAFIGGVFLFAAKRGRGPGSGRG